MSDELFKTLAGVTHEPLKEAMVGRDGALLQACEQTVRSVSWLVSQFEDCVGYKSDIKRDDVTALIRDIRREMEMYWMFKHRGEPVVHREHVQLEELERRHKSTTSLRAGWLDNNESVDVKGV